MRAITKQRGERLRSNVPGPAEMLRLAAWYEGIALDYLVALDARPLDRAKRAACDRGVREAREQAAVLYARAAAR